MGTAPDINCLLTAVQQEQADCIADYLYSQEDSELGLISPLVRCSVEAWVLWAPLIQLGWPPTVLSRLFRKFEAKQT